MPRKEKGKPRTGRREGTGALSSPQDQGAALRPFVSVRAQESGQA